MSRDRLLDAATELFLEKGYGNLSMETIARRARVSLRTLYSQFGDKAGLFGALIRRCSDQFVDTLADQAPMEQTMTAFASLFLYRTTRPDVIRIRAILIAESPRFPDLATQFYEQGPRRTLALLAEFFTRQQQAGYIVSANPQYLAEQFISALRGERFQRLQLGLEATPDQTEIETWARDATMLFLNGSAIKYFSERYD
jgi:AcrR family transcriptional regulator